MGYTLTFKSLNNETCIVNIDGGGTALTGAADPITFEEDDDTNLLRVIRTKTGYLNLVETTDGELDALHAMHNTDMPIEVTKNGKLIFFGYIQAQSFSDEQVSSPKVVQFPIASPLAVMGETYLQPIKVSGTSTLGKVMKEICTAMGYDNIVVPASLLTNDVNPMHVNINNRLASPYNPDYNFGQNDVFTPISYYEFVEAFCNLYGLIAHEGSTWGTTDSKTLVFTRFDYSGDYKQMPVSTLNSTSVTGTTITPQTLAFNNVFSIAGSDGIEDYVLPVGRIEINHGDEPEDEQMNLTLSTAGDNPGQRVGTCYNIGRVMYMIPIDVADGGEFSSYYFSLDTTFYGSQPSTDFVRIPGDENGKLYIDIAVDLFHHTQLSPNTPLFVYRFSKPPRKPFTIIFKTLNHQNLYRFKIKSGGKYLNWWGSHSDNEYYWVNSETIISDKNWDPDTGEFIFHVWEGTDYPIEFTLLPQTNTAYFGDPVVELSLNIENENKLGIYYESIINPLRIIKNEGFNDEESIDMLIHDYCPNNGRIIGCSLLAQNDYPYMLTPLRVLHQTVKLTTSIDIVTLMLANYTINNETWKMLAISQAPWDDELKVTLIKSQTS